MNDKIKQLATRAGIYQLDIGDETAYWVLGQFAELIVQECAEICMEMATKCAGLEGDGALAKDCAYWIKKDFGVEV